MAGHSSNVFRRYITKHREDGKSIYLSAEKAERHTFDVPTKLVAGRSYSISTIPAKLGNEADIREWNSEDGLASYKSQTICVPTGANVSTVYFEPGGQSMMHQTVTLDYSICVFGTIRHELDSGQVVTLKPGDHIIQRGTNHRWLNASDTDPAGLMAVVIGCEPFEVGGQMLHEHFS